MNKLKLKCLQQIAVEQRLRTFSPLQIEDGSKSRRKIRFNKAKLTISPIHDVGGEENQNILRALITNTL